MRILEATLLLAVLCVAGWLRYISATETDVEVPIRNDAIEYVAYAYNIETFGVYSKVPTFFAQDAAARPAPDAMRPPGYPAFLWLFLRGPPDSVFVSRVVGAQAVLGMLTVLLGFFAARAILGWGIALGIALLLAVCPQLVIYESYLLTETLFTLIVTATTLVAVLAFRTQRRGTMLAYAGAFGVLVAASALVRPTLQYLAPIIVLIALAVPQARRFRLPALVAALTFAIAFAPWTLRNFEVTGHASDPRLAIATLQGGSYPEFMYEHQPETYGGPSSVDPRSREISASMRTILAEIARKFREHPLEYVRWYAIGKPAAFFSWDEVSGWGWVFIYPVLRSPFLHNPEVRAISAIMTGLHYPLVICALFGMFLIWTPFGRRTLGDDSLPALRFVCVMFGFVVALHVIGTPLPRYSVPFRLPMYLLSACAIAPLVQIVARGYGRGRPLLAKT